MHSDHRRLENQAQRSCQYRVGCQWQYLRRECRAPERVTVYAAGANGNTKPIRTISGNDTGLDYPSGVDVR